MSYTLYTIAGAPRPWRVALALMIKRVPHTLRVLEASRKEHKAADVLALNPRGRVPILVGDDFVLTESLAILAYLEHEHPEPALFGASAGEEARIWEEIGQAEHDLREATSAVIAAVLEGADEHVESVRDGAVELRAELRRVDERLASTPFVCGDRASAADCFAFPDVRLVLRAEERAPEVMARLELAPLAKTVPHVRAWIDRIEALPGYERTFPPHWR